MGELKYLVLHCSATPEGREMSQNDIRRSHLGPCDLPGGKVMWQGRTYTSRQALPDIFFFGAKLRLIHGRGWGQVGYSDFIHLDGRVENLVPYDEDGIVQPREITNGALGLNGNSRHVMYVGGVDAKIKPKDTRTPEQTNALKNYVYDFIEAHPACKVLGHNQVSDKACPSFKVPEWLASIGVQKGNIYIK